MSWRLLFATLLIALGIAAWGGLQLGDWLVAHAPAASAAPGQDPLGSEQVILDANGRPYVAQPPQPRVDGTLGVPHQPAAHEWAVNTVSLFDSNTDPSVNISRGSISMDRARQLAAGSDLPTGPSDVSTLDLAQPPGIAPPANAPIQQGVARINPPVALDTPRNAPRAAGNWQDQLRQELNHCATMGFFERPSCAWAARNKYCAPNNAWGTISECPRRHE
ncbi:hypothetical protein BBB39_20125 [Bordetella trematum]|uniref:Uncharacterized protein n=1 Tax=Bordetella trematum TaxID=123899 RepID=A0A157MP25_9BORD|nr:hypothetical protein [Bordetella trematum]AUL48872.1 hypothetical protein BTL55_19255 [Bordetella trematum]AZR95815.1 hypothetical protein BBB39_20125 [Bordetella trematum]NNH18752.1 hypothetical protein [Bordetella trematum]CZZ88650.1 Uncharacterised protein [Bordetella trematum]SAI10309.1 Uncharacterised protein [Bordetella trematum]